MELVCIPPDRVGETWPALGPIVRRASEKVPLWKWTETEQEVLTGKQLLWCAFDDKEILAAATTRIFNTDGGKVCEIAAAGKSHAKWARWAMVRLEDFAKAEGCDKMRIIGRRGWSRVLPDFSEAAVILEKGL